MLETLPYQEPKEVIVPQLTPKEHNIIQGELGRRSGDSLGWIDKNSDKFRKLIESSPEIRQLVLTNREQAFEEIEQILENWKDDESS